MNSTRFLINRQLRGTSRSEQLRLKRQHRRRVRILAILCLPLIVMVRLLRPLVLVRFGYLLRHKIGHCPMEAEAYLLERAAGTQPRNGIDLFYFAYGTDGLSANLFAEHLARRHLRIHVWVEWLAVANEMLPGAEAHRIVIRFRDVHEFADVEGVLRRTTQQIDLSAEEEQLGRRLLAEMGVPAGAEFVCFHVREPSYWSARKEGVGEDSDFRNSRIENCFEAMQAVAERGYFVIRIGALAPTPLPKMHPRIIDYATGHRTEFMDVFLAARCKLMVSTASGIDTIAYFCRRPILFLNVSAWAWEYTNLPQPFLCIFRKFQRNGTLMTFSEITAAKADAFTVSGDFTKAGITLEENSPDEIREAVIEMLDLLEGKQTEDERDRIRQEKMRGHIRRSPRYANWQFPVSKYFLRKHETLL